MGKKAKDGFSWDWLQKTIIVSIIGLLVYFIKAIIDRNSNAPKVSITGAVKQDTTTRRITETGGNVYQNSSSGQQNNNTGSGEQVIIKK